MFAFAVALQYLLWGLLQPAVGAFSEQFGAGRVIFIGGLLYAAGVYGMAIADTPLMLALYLGVLIAFGVSGAGVGIVLGVVGRAVDDSRRSLYLGIVLAGGSFGMFVMVPFGQWLIYGMGWQQSLVLLALVALLMPLAAVVLRGKPEKPPPSSVEASSPLLALRMAGMERRYWLLFWGYFVCGFHVFFIATHLPASLTDQGLGSEVGAMALSLIGLFNIFGSLLAGYLGGRFSKRRLLSLIYLLRSGVIIVFVALPLSVGSVAVFSATIGLLWLSTVPLTVGLVGQMFGVRYLSTLSGVVFLGHQMGGFLGVWLGGLLFDLTGSYDLVWRIAIGLGVFAALIHLPIDERTPGEREASRQPKPAQETPG